MNKNRNSINAFPLICGSVCLICCLISRILSGSTFDTAYRLSQYDIVPPMWIFNLMSMIWYFLMGVAAGNIICLISQSKICGISIAVAYKGMIYFTACFFFGLIWYCQLFVNEAIFLSLIISFMALICSSICAYRWFECHGGLPAFIMLGNSFWLFYITFLSLSIAMRA